MPLVISRTKSFRQFQAHIGTATYRLNTILVGLEHIAAGGGKPDTLAVTWKKPAPEKANEVANQARMHACISSVALTNEVLDEYIKSTTEEPGLNLPSEVVKIIKKEEARPNTQGGAYSLAERVSKLCEEINLNEPALIAATDLFSKWRNSIIHRSVREPKISNKTNEILLSATDYFYKNYSHLNIALAIDNYSRGKIPVPKEATSMMALSQNLARKINNSILARSISSDKNAESLCLLMLHEYFSGLEEPKINRQVSDIWTGKLLRRKTTLIRLLKNLGFAEESNKEYFGILSDESIENMAEWDTLKARHFLKI